MKKNAGNESELDINKGLIIRNQHFDVYDMIKVHNVYKMAFCQFHAESVLLCDYGIANVASDVTEKMAGDIIRNIDKYDYSIGDAIKEVCSDYCANGKLEYSDSTDKKHLRYKGMDIKGIHLDMNLMESINGFYETAATQEYIYENTNVSVKKARDIAVAVRKKMSENLFLTEGEAIKSVFNNIRSKSR